jgi:heme-degrading monooxygenase HmoA
MTRRKSMAALGAALAAPLAAAHEPIQLHVDLDVTPGKEAEMTKNFKTVFRPVISKQPGFVDVKLMKMRSALKGTAPSNAPYRLVISFKTEEQRLTWVKTDDHQRVWPSIENTLRGAKFGAVLYDLV